MKRRTKLLVLGATIFTGAALLTGCTKSFCSTRDKAHIMYCYDYGVSDYYDAAHKPDEAQQVFEGNTNLYYVLGSSPKGSGIGKTNADSAKSSIAAPSMKYYEEIDKLVLESALLNAGYDKTTVTLDQAVEALDQYGYLKYGAAEFEGDTNKLVDKTGEFVVDKVTGEFVKNKKGKKIKYAVWDGWYAINERLRDMAALGTNGLTIDDLPNNDYLKLYEKDLKALTNSYRSCIAITEADYGYYGYANGLQYRPQDKVSTKIEAKDWGYAWKQGPLEGLLVFPIAWLTETFVAGFLRIHVANGLAQLLAIFAITFIVRGLMLVVTLKQTSSTAKMQNLQPEITKIQNKYPNANKNAYEKQQMAAEMSKLYKKNKINPLSSLLVMVVQFPVFICVWGALQGCASLSTGAIFNLHLSDSISAAMFGSNGANWLNGSAETALILFLLMAGAQVVSMLLPQWIQKMKRKKIATLGKNPTQTEQQSRMKMFTYIMMAMIIFMGFTLPSAMGVYWFVGALFSIGQTLVIKKINNNKAKKKGR